MAIRRTWAVLLAAAIFSMNGHAQAPRAEMVDGFNSGWIHFGVSGTEHVDGVTPLREVITQLVTRS